MDPASRLERHGLPTEGLQRVPLGTATDVWRTDRHIVRLGAGADHRREARIARGALAAGVRTARPVACGPDYGIWQRLRGAPASQARTIPAATWDELLADLERLHAAPPEPPPRDEPAPWRGAAALVDRTQHLAGWSARERDALRRALDTVRPVRHPAFVHGDAWARNVLVDDAGRYVGVIDWGCARWTALEEECARLEDPALGRALERWRGRLDLPLLYALRIELLLSVALRGRASFGRVRGVLLTFEQLR